MDQLVISDQGFFYKQHLVHVRAWISNYIHCFPQNIMIHQFSNFNEGLAKQSLAKPPVTHRLSLWSPKRTSPYI